MKINWKKALGYGTLFYLIIYIVATAFVAYGIKPQENNLAWLIMMAVTLVAGYFLSLRLDMKNYVEALLYGAVWVALMVVYDLILTVPFTGISFFQNWQFVTGMIVGLLLPAGSLFVHGLLKSSK